MDIILTAVAVIVVAFVLSYLHERRLWNKGTCRKCHTRWESFDMDSSGATGYKCACSYEWFSWPLPGQDVTR